MGYKRKRITLAATVLKLVALETAPNPKWSIQRPPSPGGAQNVKLASVSCISQPACVAVGSYDISGGSQSMLVERWDGARWSIQRSSGPVGTVGSSLSSVSCAPTGGCTAVGSYTPTPGPQRALAVRWTGTAWSLQQPPSPTGAPTTLNGVSCPSASACTAIGGWSRGTLVERWNGRRWSIQPSPSPATLDSYGGAASVSCPSPTTCTAVWSGYTSPGGKATVVERWSGHR